MADFKGLGYCTIYESTGTVHHDMGRDCCFHTVTCDDVEEEMDNKYNILINIGSNYMKETSYNNACFLSLEDINKYLKILQSYFPFTYSIQRGTYTESSKEDFDLEVYDNEVEGLDYYSLDMHISGNMMVHKFLLKMIRGLYEYPFNMSLMDVLKLRKLPRFKRFNTANLYLLVGYLNMIVCGGNDDQFICYSYRGFPNFFTIEQWKDSLLRAGNDSTRSVRERYINNIYDYRRLNEDLGRHNMSIIDCAKRNNVYGENNSLCYNISYWYEEDYFNKRVEFYSNYLKEFIR